MQADSNHRQCPQCKSLHIASVHYGKPRMTCELVKEIDEGRVVLGGCMIDNTHANYYCNHCHHYWA